MSRPLPPLNAIRAFVAASRHLSFSRAAEELGISQPALYSYFATKDDLIADLCVRAFAILSARMAAAKADWSPTHACFDKAMRVYIDFGLENPDAYRVAFMIEKSHDGQFLGRTGGRPMQAGVAAFGEFRRGVGVVLGLHVLHFGLTGGPGDIEAGEQVGGALLDRRGFMIGAGDRQVLDRRHGHLHGWTDCLHVRVGWWWRVLRDESPLQELCLHCDWC